MHDIGDKIFHPIHGIGVIESIASQEVMGEKRDYYLVNLTMKKMSIFIPVATAEEVGLRKIVKSHKVDDALKVLKSKKPTEAPANWNQRFKLNMTKISTGDIKEVAEVLVSLSQKKTQLSMSEMSMMNNAISLIAGELSYSKNIEYEKAKACVEKALH